jgi:hypothetical protein
VLTYCEQMQRCWSAGCVCRFQVGWQGSRHPLCGTEDGGCAAQGVALQLPRVPRSQALIAASVACMSSQNITLRVA